MAEKRAGAAVWIASLGGVGHFPLVPGSVASAVGCLLMAMSARLGLSRTQMQEGWGVTALGALALGIWAAGRAEEFFRRPDPGQVVIDELVGQITTFLAQPDFRVKWLLIGFILFRTFDVLKPFPAGRAERLPGGWGIMLDDVVAGVYGLATLRLIGSVLK